MGWQDFITLGRGSRLGKWWPTIGLAIRVTFVGLVLALVLGARSPDYIPWLATGWTAWGMISSAITGTSGTMNRNRGLMLTLQTPKEAFIVKVIVKEIALLVQNLLVVLGVLIAFRVTVTYAVLLLIPGLLITAAFLYGLGMIIAPLSAKYKDLVPFISAITGVMFFVLPIMWQPQLIESGLARQILGLNPLYHYLQVVRLPLLSEVPTGLNYLLTGTGAIAVLVIGMLVMRKTRNKIVYWI